MHRIIASNSWIFFKTVTRLEKGTVLESSRILLSKRLKIKKGQLAIHVSFVVDCSGPKPIHPTEFPWEKGKIQCRLPTLCRAPYCLPACALKALLKRSKSINAFLSLNSSTRRFLGTSAANLIESIKESQFMLSCILWGSVRAKNFPSKAVGIERLG